MKAAATKCGARLAHGLAMAFAIITSAAIVYAQSSANAPTVVQIDAGAVRGQAEHDVLAFKGIPFAEPRTTDSWQFRCR